MTIKTFFLLFLCLPFALCWFILAIGTAWAGFKDNEPGAFIFSPLFYFVGIVALALTLRSLGVLYQ